MVSCAIAFAGCFPDEALKPPRDAARADAVSDIQAPDVDDAGGPDAPMDAADDLAPDVAAPDVAAPADADDAAVPDAADASRCGSLPRDPVLSMMVYDRLVDPTDMAFNGAGQLAVASGRDVNLLGSMDSRTLLFSALPGNVAALRYSGTGEMLLAMVPTASDGTLGPGRPGEGALYGAPATGSSPPMYRQAVARPGGLAVDRANAVWFSDTTANRVYRATTATTDGGAAGTDVAEVITDINGPTLLAFDASGRTLYVGSGQMNGTLYRVDLMETATGGVMAGFARGLARDLGAISGLAVDVCGDVYVADELGNRILRGAPPAMEFAPIVQGADSALHPRALAFGQGGSFDDSTLFFLSMNTVRAASVMAPGVPLPVPPR